MLAGQIGPMLQKRMRAAEGDWGQCTLPPAIRAPAGGGPCTCCGRSVGRAARESEGCISVLHSASGVGSSGEI